MKIDLHNHLGVNGQNPGFDETINIVWKRLGFNSVFGICNDGPIDYRYENFTNQKGGSYERVWLDDEKRVLYVPQKEIYVVGVEEVEPKEGHFIVVGMPQNKKIWKSKTPPSLEDALKSANDFKGAKIAVHPCGRDGLMKYLKENDATILMEFDGWEIYNASAELSIPGVLPRDANKNSINFYHGFLPSYFDMGVCAFTDGHSAEVIGRSYTLIPLIPELESQDFLNSLTQGIRENKFLRNLHMEPAKWDSFKHVYHMAKHMVFNTGA